MFCVSRDITTSNEHLIFANEIVKKNGIYKSVISFES